MPPLVVKTNRGRSLSFTGANHPAQDVAASLDQLAVLLVDDQKNNRNAVSTVEVPAHVNRSFK